MMLAALLKSSGRLRLLDRPRVDPCEVGPIQSVEEQEGLDVLDTVERGRRYVAGRAWTDGYRTGRVGRRREPKSRLRPFAAEWNAGYDVGARVRARSASTSSKRCPQ